MDHDIQHGMTQDAELNIFKCFKCRKSVEITKEYLIKLMIENNGRYNIVEKFNEIFPVCEIDPDYID